MRRLILLLIIIGGFIPLAQTQTSSESEEKQYTAHVVGYAHMDMAWLWRWEESIHDIMYNTFRNPDQADGPESGLHLCAGPGRGPRLHGALYPDVFKGLDEKARTGNFIPVTSGWVQMDENVIDGESLVRQFLYGQKYSKEKFGHYVRLAWQPDVFGHPDSMPQIASKGGH